MFKVFLSVLFFFTQFGAAHAQQTAFEASENMQERNLSKYINASAVCAKMTDADALYERGMLLISDANEDAYLAAADCFTSAAMKNHTPSQLELGKLYEQGHGVSASSVYAYKWYQTAVLLGNQDAVPYRDKIEARMTLDEIAKANPMIQSTLTLVDLFNTRQQTEIEKYEREIDQKYIEFGVDIRKYDIQDSKGKDYSNPLIEALIREQTQKEKANLLKNQKNNEQRGENEMRNDWEGRREELPSGFMPN